MESLEEEFGASEFDTEEFEDGVDTLAATVAASLGNFNQPVFTITKTPTRAIKNSQLSLLASEDDVTTAATVEGGYAGYDEDM
jgi:hypothetical protein